MSMQFPDLFPLRSPLLGSEPENSQNTASGDESWLVTHPFGDNTYAFESHDRPDDGGTEADLPLAEELASVLARLTGFLANAQGGSGGQAATFPCANTPGNGITGAAAPAPAALCSGGIAQAAMPDASAALLAANPQSAYTSFQASSVGDPHDAFSGTTAGGQSVDAHWDNMQSHGDLLHSSSFAGGFAIRSDVTAPQGNGVTMNGRVDVLTAGGRDDISFTADGTARVRQNGAWETLAPGSGVTLGDGTDLRLSSDDRLTVTKQNGSGGAITSTLSPNGQGGVDVRVQGQNVSLGGYLAGHDEATVTA